MCGRFKHCDLIDVVSECPASMGALARARPAVHFIYLPLEDTKRNFVPARKKKPQRKLRPEDECRACGISVYDSEAQARAMHDYLQNGHPNAPIKVGTHLALAQLTEKHGESGASDEHGHFTFFEYAGADATGAFHLVEAPL
jgi:hypothetical protein